MAKYLMLVLCLISCSAYSESYHMIGDSIFATLDHRVSSNLSKMSGIQIVDHSVSGAWMNQILDQYKQIRGQADVIIMDGGGNNVLGNSGNCQRSMNAACKQVIDTAISELRSGIQMMVEDGVDTFIFLGVHYPKKWNSGYVQAVDYAYTQINTICDYTPFSKCVVIDGRSILNNDNLLIWDGVHPNDTGAYKIAEAIYTQILK